MILKVQIPIKCTGDPEIFFYDESRSTQFFISMNLTFVREFFPVGVYKIFLDVEHDELGHLDFGRAIKLEDQGW